MAKPRIRHPATAYIGRGSGEGMKWVSGLLPESRCVDFGCYGPLNPCRAITWILCRAQSGLWMTRTELWKCEMVAAATEPARWPSRPLRWCEPITIRPQV